MKICVINGPNLNLLGVREPEIYGRATLEEINEGLRGRFEPSGVDLLFRQSNHEGDLVSFVQEAMLSEKADGVVINAGALAHTSIAIRDAIAGVGLPTIEVHISNTAARESFRHHSMIADVVDGRIEGLGIVGYRYAIEFLVDRITEASDDSE